MVFKHILLPSIHCICPKYNFIPHLSLSHHILLQIRYHVPSALKMSNPNFGATTTAEEVASTYSSQIKGKTSTQILQVLVTLFDQAPTN